MLSGIFIFMNIEVYLLENKQLQYRTFLTTYIILRWVLKNLTAGNFRTHLYVVCFSMKAWT